MTPEQKEMAHFFQLDHSYSRKRNNNFISSIVLTGFFMIFNILVCLFKFAFLKSGQYGIAFEEADV